MNYRAPIPILSLLLLSLALPAVQAQEYSVNLGWASGLVPFRYANVDTGQTWYAIEKNQDTLIVSQGMMFPHPDVTLYPTVEQMNEYRSIAWTINKNGMSWDEVGNLMKLWYQVKKGGN